MDDRELLEMAVKACGGKVLSRNDFGDLYQIGERQLFWAPLDDDGDALWLSVQLGLSVERSRFVVHVSAMPTEDQADADERGAFLSAESLGKGALCPFKATRRAIVRAAAEIGKAMP